MPEPSIDIIIQGFLEGIALVMIAAIINVNAKLPMIKLVLYAAILSVGSFIMSIIQVSFHMAITIPLTIVIYLLLKKPLRAYILNYIADLVFSFMILSFIQLIFTLIASGLSIRLMDNPVARLCILGGLVIVFIFLSKNIPVHAFFEKYYLPYRATIVLAIISLLFMQTIITNLSLYYEEDLSPSGSKQLLIIIIVHFIVTLLFGISLLHARMVSKKNTIMLKYGKQLQNSVVQYREAIHDYKHQLQFIITLNRNEDGSVCNSKMNDYIKTLLENRNRQDDISILNEDVFISALLSQQQEFAKQKSIPFFVNIVSASAEYKIPNTEFIDILNNLINNAFEEAEKLDPENRFVQIIFDKKEIVIENSFSFGTIKSDPERFFEQGYTTKGTGRGYGLSNVYSIAKQNNINIKCNRENNLIVFRLKFPD